MLDKISSFNSAVIWNIANDKKKKKILMQMFSNHKFV